MSELCITCGTRPRRSGAGQRRCNCCAHRREDPEKKRRRDKESHRRWREKIGVDEWRRRAREFYRAKRPRELPRPKGRKPRTLEKRRGERWRRRLLAIAALGGKCERCGIDDPDVLQFDHRVPVGSKRRRGLKHKASSYGSIIEVLSMKDPANRFSLLCANCHVKKTRSNGDYMAKPGEREQDNGKESEASPALQLSLFSERPDQKHASGSFRRWNPRVAGDLGFQGVGE